MRKKIFIVLILIVFIYILCLYHLNTINMVNNIYIDNVNIDSIFKLTLFKVTVEIALALVFCKELYFYNKKKANKSSICSNCSTNKLQTLSFNKPINDFHKAKFIFNIILKYILLPHNKKTIIKNSNIHNRIKYNQWVYIVISFSSSFFNILSVCEYGSYKNNKYKHFKIINQSITIMKKLIIIIKIQNNKNLKIYVINEITIIESSYLIRFNIAN